MQSWKRWAPGLLSVALLFGCSKGGIDRNGDADLGVNGADLGFNLPDLAGADLAHGGPDLSQGGPDLAGPPSGDARWQKGAGGAQNDSARGVVSDRSGNVYVTGVFSGVVDFGAGPLTSAGDSDLFLLKYDAAGALVFAKRFGSNSSDTGVSVAVTSKGELVVLGGFSGAVDFGGGPLNSAGSMDYVVAKFSASGAHVWSRRFGGSLDDQPIALSLDTHDNILVAGQFSGRVDFGSGPLDAYNGSDHVLLKLDPEGAPAWVKRIGGQYNDRISGVATDATDGIAITGNFDAPIDFGSGSVTPSDRHSDGFLVKYKPDGSFLWMRRMIGYSGEYGAVSGIACDGAGSFVVTGWFAGGIDLGSGRLVSRNANDEDVFVGKYAADGSPLWSIRAGGLHQEFGNAVAVDAAGAVVVTGSFMETADFGGGMHKSAGLQDVFIAKYSANGSHVWSRTLGGTEPDEGLTVATDPLGNVLVGGAYSLMPDFGGGPLPAARGKDMFVIKRAP